MSKQDDYKQQMKVELVIVKYNDQYAEAFDRLNQVWLRRYSLYEEEDRKYLEHPKEMIIDKGGEIFFALKESEVIGTCAMIPDKENIVELAKLAVDDKFQGQGIGRLLTELAIEWARERGFKKIVLLSSTKLKQALFLYEKLGFSYLPLPHNTCYETADIYMEFIL